MVDTRGFFLIALGFFILFLGWLSLIPGIIGLFIAQDFSFLIQVEDMVFVERTVSASSIVFSMIIRIILGFFFIVIGNSFLVEGFQKHRGIEHICHPRFQDLTQRRI